MAGAGRASALWQSVIIGVTNLVFTLLAMTVIDRVGRRRLLLVGSLGLAACLFAAAWAFERKVGSVLLVSLIGYIAFFAFSQGAVIWVFISEIFPNAVRSYGNSLGSATHWVFAALIANIFPWLAGRFGGGPIFAFFAVMMVFQLLFVWKMMPETKGVSLENLEKQLLDVGLSHEALFEISAQLTETMGLIDEKSMRWLELSEMEG